MVAEECRTGHVVLDSNGVANKQGAELALI